MGWFLGSKGPLQPWGYLCRQAPENTGVFAYQSRLRKNLINESSMYGAGSSSPTALGKHVGQGWEG